MENFYLDYPKKNIIINIIIIISIISIVVLCTCPSFSKYSNILAESFKD